MRIFPYLCGAKMPNRKRWLDCFRYEDMKNDLTPLQREIFSGRICPYCGAPTELIDSAEIYGYSYGKLYICRPCNAYVGCYRGTDLSFGSVADEELRHWRNEAHQAFDPLWKERLFPSRYAAYRWLARRMQTPVQYTHMGMYDVEQCKRVVELAAAFRASILSARPVI